MNTTQHKSEKSRDTKQEETQRNRKKRGGGALGKRLGVPPALTDFNKFAYRWINDDGMRMYSLTEEDDWQLAPQDGEKTETVDMGSAVKRVVGTKADGSPMYAYLCRKLRTYFDDDQKAKSAELDEQLEQLRRGNNKDGAGQSDYTPHSGINIR